jgi:PKD repeat protein
VGSWMILALGQNGPTGERFTTAAQSRLLNTYVSRDVASAELVRVSSPAPTPSLVDCSPSADGTPTTVMNVVFLDSEQQWVVYQVHDNEFGGTSLYRRTCTLTSDRAMTGEMEILRGVKPGSVQTTCVLSGANCKTVTFQATLQSTIAAADVPLEVTATVRSSVGDLAGNNGTFRPVAVISITNRTERAPDHGLSVSFDATRSTDLDTLPQALTYRWEAEGQGAAVIGPSATFTWNGVGSYRVTLTVTDDTGNVATATETVRLVNQPPVITTAGATVGGGEPIGEVGVSTFSFTAAADDPDSAAQPTYTWTLDNNTIASGPSANLLFPSGTPTGSLTVLLVVTDGDGGQTTQSVPITLTLGGTTTTTTTPTSSSTSTTVPSTGPDAGFTWVVNGPSAPALVDFTPATMTAFSHLWDFGVAGQTAASSAANPQYLFPNPGTYNVSHTVTAISGSNTTVQAVNIPGSPATPPPPGWSGNNVVWAAIPGVTRYRVVVAFLGTNADSTPCVKPGVSSFVDAGQPLTAFAGNNTCANPTGSSATLSVLANTWSSPSAESPSP